ncbi:MAG: twin-arginine translocase TatA/TatE family subunit [Microbacteriaceae bacterium]
MKLNGFEWVIILVIVLLFWGAPKLPGLAKGLAESLKIFKKEMKSTDEKADAKPKSDDKPSE